MDFDSFLEDISSEAARQERATEYVRELENRLWDAIERHNPSRIIDQDPDREQAFRREIMNSQIRQIWDYARQHPDEYPYDLETTDELIHTQARTAVSTRQIDELKLVKDIQVLTVLYETGQEMDDEERLADVTDAKKALTAHIIILYEKTPDDPWIAVLDEMVPPGSLNTADPEDEKYLLQAMERLANQSEEQKRYNEITEESYRIAGITTQSSLEERAVISNMLTIGANLQGGLKNNANAERAALLTEYATQNGVSNDTTRRLIAFIETQFPIRSF